MIKTNFQVSLRIRRAKTTLCLGLICVFLSACSSKPIATVTSEAEAIEIIDVLREYEIVSDKTEVGDERTRQYQIFVSEGFFGGDGQMAAYQILVDHCLPHREPPPVQEGGLIASNEAEKAKIQRQLKIGIIGQLRKLPGVTCVDVNFVQPQDQLAALNPYPATASVFISYKNQDPSFTQQDVQNLVASSVPGLQPDKVAAKLTYQPVNLVIKSNRNLTQRLILIGAAGLFIILGSAFLIYFLQKRRQQSTALALIEQPENLDEAGAIET